MDGANRRERSDLSFVDVLFGNESNNYSTWGDNMADMHKVASSNIDSIGYDKASSTLHVGFLSSGVYKFAGVPEEVYEGFKSAKSKGSYFATVIRPNYKGEKV